MRIFKRMLCASVALSLITSAAVTAQGAEKSWIINADLKSDVEDFIQNSDIVKEMRTLKLPNTMVYSVDPLHGPMLPIYDLLACLHLTNPKSEMKVDSGGGYDISMAKVTFPGGVWDASIRFREVQQINLLESQNVYLLDRTMVGTTRLRARAQRVRLVQQLSGACFASAVSKE